MEERHISQLIQNLVDRFEYLGQENFNLPEELAVLQNPVTRENLDEESVEKIKTGFLDRIRYKESFEGAHLVPVSMVAAREHEEWYAEWLAGHNDAHNSYYWKRLEHFLSIHLTAKYGPEHAGRIVRSIDEATFTIMKKIADPSRREFSYKGLVVGYVQSGKTANFTALISKAADAGYKLIIVLAGIHNTLRRQTQVRLDRELTGIRDIDSPDPYIEQPGAARAWSRITTAHNDFQVVNLGRFETFCQRETPTLAVVKKNVSVLNRLIDYISAAPENLRASMPVLIIDDEADQASIDTNANNPDTDPSRTNERIRALLRLFTRKAYVGYTATPFANVLVDMSVEHPGLEDDLYPRNFVASLPEPEGYFGTSTIFQGTLAGRFVIEIPDEANELIRHNTMTDNLSQAIDQFILCCAVRNLRGDKTKPMSMLVHVSHRIDDMSTINGLITDYVDTIKRRYQNNTENAILRENQFQPIWNEFERNAVEINTELNTQNVLPPFDAIWDEIRNVFEILDVLELNSNSEDTLDYTTGEEIKVIAIGGNQLSRGLTLEGLMSSYYLRASRQYDTLLQMGRWFGYRKGYEDLTRIHTTEQIWGFFEHLALVEEELRSEIYRYEEEDKTPLEMALAIRDHRNLTVTARNKIGAGRVRQASYSDSLNQTIWYPLDKPDILRANYNLGESFINKINDEAGFTASNGVFVSNVLIDGDVILREFLNRYTFVDTESTGGPGLDAESLLAYIYRRLNDQPQELTGWKVVVVGNVNPKAGNTPVNYGGITINRIQRSRKYTERGYNIGVLTEPDHLSIGLNAQGEREIPLLLLYSIWKDSEAARYIENPVYDQRIDLFRDVQTDRVDVLGIAVALPQSRFEPNNYIGQ